MPEGDRNSGFALVTAIVAVIELVLIVALSFELAASHTERQLRADHNSQQNTQNTYDNLDVACTGRDGRSLIECIKEQIEAAEEYRRDEYDLSAQQDMADWARWMIWVSVGSVAVTTLGVFFVWQTLREAKSTTSAALLASEHAKRQADEPSFPKNERAGVFKMRPTFNLRVANTMGRASVRKPTSLSEMLAKDWLPNLGSKVASHTLEWTKSTMLFRQLNSLGWMAGPRLKVEHLTLA